MKLMTRRTVLYAACLLAALSGGFALQRFAGAAEPRTAACAAQDPACYVLRDCGGYVAVYDGADSKKPATVTDIEVSTLRALDRQMIENGLVLDSREKLVMTLEDLGS